MNSCLKKRFIIAIMLLISGSFMMSAQTISKWTVIYDNDFNAVVKATVRNTTNKTITSIEFNVGTKPKHAYPTNFTADKYISKKITRTISPNNSSSFDIIVKLKDGYRVTGIQINSVRFSDGTIR